MKDGEFLEKEQLGEVSGEVSAEVTQRVDGRQLKSLYWRSLNQGTAVVILVRNVSEFFW